jgi:hypothetical protein
VRVQHVTGVQVNLGSTATPLPVYRRDYVRIAAWLFAVLFGPTLIALAVILVTNH